VSKENKEVKLASFSDRHVTAKRLY